MMDTGWIVEARHKTHDEGWQIIGDPKPRSRSRCEREVVLARGGLGSRPLMFRLRNVETDTVVHAFPDGRFEPATQAPA